MPRSLKLSRRMQPAKSGRLWQTHARQIGEIAIAWNWLNAACFDIFHTVSVAKHPLHLNIARSIWHSFQSDKAQRQMMLDSARLSLGTKSRPYIQLKWFKDQVDKLASSRNDPIHTPIAFSTDASGNTEVVPHALYAKYQSVIRLENAPLSKTWRRIRGDLHVLSLFAQVLNLHLREPQRPLPRRPRLLSLPKNPSHRNRSRRGRGRPPPPP
jgi:hypothetical protein